MVTFGVFHFFQKKVSLFLICQKVAFFYVQDLGKIEKMTKKGVCQFDKFARSFKCSFYFPATPLLAQYTVDTAFGKSLKTTAAINILLS